VAVGCVGPSTSIVDGRHKVMVAPSSYRSIGCCDVNTIEPSSTRSGKRLVSKDSMSPGEDAGFVHVAAEHKPTLNTATARRRHIAEVHIPFSNPSSTLPLPGAAMSVVAGAICKILVSSMCSYPSCSTPVHLHTKRSS
jgi:hypothetical protein